MNPTTKKWLLIGGALLALSAYGNADSDAPASPATPVAPALTPLDPPTSAAVGRLAALAKTNPQAAKAYAPLYRAAAEIVRRDTETVTNTQAWQDASDKAQMLYASLVGVTGGIPGWDDAFSVAMKSALGGKENKAIEGETRAKLAATFDAIAQACEGA